MGIERNDGFVIKSSIALLQERFKQLERVKVMREEREQIHRTVIDHHHHEPKKIKINQYNVHYYYDHDHDQPISDSTSNSSTKIFFHFLPVRSSSSSPAPPKSSLSSPSLSSSDVDDTHPCVETPLLFLSLQAKQTSTPASIFTHIDSGYDDKVDTSLHL